VNQWYQFSSFSNFFVFFLVNGEHDVEIEEEEDGEELYELASFHNGETSDFSSEAEGAQSDEQLEKSDADEKDAAGCLPEAAIHFQKAIIEEIRFVNIICLHPVQVSVRFSQS